MAILLFLNLKGGVAKTTNAVAVAECLASRGKRVLVIDADHQCAASELLLGESRLNQAEKKQLTLHDLLASMLDEEFDPEQIAPYVAIDASRVQDAKPFLRVIPGSVRIDDFQTNMAKAKRGFHTNDEFQAVWRRRRSVFKRWLTQCFDFVIVDCPPTLAPQVKFLLRVADGYIVPTVPDRISVRGSLWLQDRLAKLSSPPAGLGTLWTLFREQNERHKTMVALGQKRAGTFGKLPPPFKTIIPNSTDVVRALESEEEPRSFKAKYTAKFANLYDQLSNEIMSRV